MKSSVTAKGADTLINLHVLPSSSRNAVGETRDGFIKIKITSAAVGGKANSALVAFLSKRLKAPKSGIRIIRGETAKRKTVLVSGKKREEVLERLRGKDD